MRKRGLIWAGMAVLILVAANACGSPQPGTGQERATSTLKPPSPAPGEKLKVVATTTIVGDVVKNVGGDQIELTTLMGIGVDPHTYVPTPADAAAVHDAHILFANGAGLEANLEEMLDSAGGQAIRVHLSDGLELRPPVEEPHPGEADADHEEGDPHVWFDVQNVIAWVGIIERGLAALDPAHAAAYHSRAEAYVQELEAMDAWIVEQVATIPVGNRRLVTNHPAFGYFAARYGLEQVGAVYPVNPSVAQQVAHDTGIKLVPLYTGSLGGPGSGAETYIELMRYDVQAIVAALK